MFEISAMTIDDYDEAMSLWRQTPELGVFPSFDSHDGRRGSFFHVAVAEGHRHGGIGAAMLERSVAGLREAGIDSGYLFARSTNAGAAAFWNSRGFQPTPGVIYYSRGL